MSAESPRPLWYLAGLPGFPDVTVTAQPVHEEVQFDYNGWPEDLIALGVMQPEWLTPTGKRLHDLVGGKVSVSRRWRVFSPEAPPRRYCVIKRSRPLGEISRWPGVQEALEAYCSRYSAWRTVAAAPVTRAQPTLQLVVDNMPQGAS